VAEREAIEHVGEVEAAVEVVLELVLSRLFLTFDLCAGGVRPGLRR
jgi:hypothetical protein